MKKKFLAVVGILFVFFLGFTGCTNKKIDIQEKNERFDTKAASNLIDNYMRGLIRQDYDSVKKLYSEDMLKEEGKYKKSDIIVRGYRVEDITELGKTSIFKIKAVSTRNNSAYAALDEYRIGVVKEKSGYKIGDVKITPQKEVFCDESGIRMRDKKNVDTNLVIDMEKLPKFALSKDDKLSIYKQEVPKKAFSNMGISFDGMKVLISTYGKDSYAASVTIDESLAVQGPKKSQGKENGGEQQPSGYKGIKEKPIGKEMLSLDVVKDCYIDYMTFSQDEKFIMMQYTKSDGTKCIRIYESDSGKIAPVKFEESFPLDKVNVQFYYFDKENMVFQVLPKKGQESQYKDLTGIWQLNLKEFKIKRI